MRTATPAAIPGGREARTLPIAALAIALAAAGPAAGQDPAGPPAPPAVPASGVDTLGDVVGRVVSRDGHVPLGNVRVFLLGTPGAGRYDVTDSGGRFRIEGVPAGSYALTWHHPELLGPDTSATPVPVAVEPGDPRPVTLRVPATAADLLGCPAGRRSSGIIYGQVLERQTRTPLGHATVTVEDAFGRRIQQRADSDGGFLFCDVVAGPYTVEARFADFRAPRIAGEIPEGGARHVQLAMGVAAAGRSTGRIIGRVLDAHTGEPVPGVTLHVAGRTRISDGEGGFHFSGIRPGAVELVAEHIAYEESRGSLAVVGGQTVRVDVTLATRPIQLDPVVVTAVSAEASSRLADFRYRVQRGYGRYVLREDIERRGASQLAHLVAEHGMDITQGRGQFRTSLSVFNRRAGCSPTVYIDGIQVARGRDGEAAASALEMLHPHEVEGIEVYTSPLWVPAEFSGPGSECGVIAVWSRR